MRLLQHDCCIRLRKAGQSKSVLWHCSLDEDDPVIPLPFAKTVALPQNLHFELGEELTGACTLAWCPSAKMFHH